jgi:predicted RNA-binding protein (virulence factor B family)
MNVELGKFNLLEVVKTVDFGVYLDGHDDGEILLPTRYVPEGCKPGDKLNVFIYLDIDERLIATTLQPRVQVGEFACLEVAWVNEFGAFLDWGLMKDLFCPFREQKMKMAKGRRYVIHAHLDDESYRIMASAKVERYLSKDIPPYKPGQEVPVMIWQRTDLGYKVIVDNRYSGLVYQNEVFSPVEIGDHLTAYVKQVRTDGKIDLSLQKYGAAKVGDFATQFLDYLKAHNGFTPLGDKSAAEDIYDTFGVSKKTFKKTIGELYKKRAIVIKEEGISLNS